MNSIINNSYNRFVSRTSYYSKTAKNMVLGSAGRIGEASRVTSAALLAISSIAKDSNWTSFNRNNIVFNTLDKLFLKNKYPLTTKSERVTFLIIISAIAIPLLLGYDMEYVNNTDVEDLNNHYNDNYRYMLAATMFTKVASGAGCLAYEILKQAQPELTVVQTNYNNAYQKVEMQVVQSYVEEMMVDDLAKIVMDYVDDVNFSRVPFPAVETATIEEIKT